MDHVIGVDIGGSHITAAMVNAVNGRVLNESRSRSVVDAGATAPTIISDWCKVIQSAAAARLTNNLKIGIAMPGPFDYEEGICLIKEQDKFRKLYRINLKLELAKALSLPADNLRFLNDAASFLQGEVLYGAAAGASTALGITLGTGLGSAIYTSGYATDAELWKMPFKKGMAEDYLNTRWFVNEYKDLTGKDAAGVKELITEATLSERTKIFEAFVKNLSRFLLTQLKKQAVEKIVIGGNIAKASSHFFPLLKQALAQGGYTGEVTRGLLDEDAALIGAAGCWRLPVENLKAV